MTAPIVLRPDQAALKSSVYAGWQAGARNVLAIAPTGSGKTVLSTDIILDGHQQGMTECIMAHRNELVGQMSIAVGKRAIPHRIIGSRATIAAIVQEHRQEFGRSFVNPDARCAVGSVQTIVSRADQLRQWAQQVNRWTLDEAHHAIGNDRIAPNMWGKAINLFPNAYGLGVTACPTRADGQGLGWEADGPFNKMVIGPTMRELIDLKALSEYEIIIPTTDYNIGEDAITAKGDYSPKKMREASKRSHIVSDAVTEYRRWIPGKRAICFATDVETANDIARQFNECGISAASVSAKTDTAVRRDMIKRFKDGRLLVLVNVDLFDEGFDVPGCDAVIMARPTASLNKYLQMFGRALRVAIGKTHGTIIDLVSNVIRHGLPDKQHIWTLDRREKRAKRAPDPDDIELTACRECSRPYERTHSACPYCGHQPVPAGGGRSIDQVDGDLMLLDRDALARLRASMQLEAPAEVQDRVTAAAGAIAGKGAANRQMERHQSQQRLRETIEQWAGVRRAMGDSDSAIQRRFYLTLGVDVLTAMSGKRAEMDSLADRVESWYA